MYLIVSLKIIIFLTYQCYITTITTYTFIHTHLISIQLLIVSFIHHLSHLIAINPNILINNMIKDKQKCI